MAFTFKGLGGSAGLATTNASSVTLTTATTAGAEGDLAVLLIAVDNAQTTDGDESAVTSVTDNSGAGNTWIKAGEFTNGQGTAQTGATVGIWYCDLKGAMAVGSVITVNFSNNTLRDAQGLSLAFFSTTRPDVALEGTATTLANDAAAAGSMNGPTTSTSIEILRVRATASEANVSTVWTKTAAFDGLFTVGVSTGGTSTSKMGIRGEYEISTGNATLASAPTGGAGAVDNASLYVCFKEVAGSFSAAATLAGAGSLSLTQSLIQIQRVALATLAGAGGLTADATVVTGGSGPPWTWNPSDKSANIALSGGNLVAAGSVNTDSNVRGTVGVTSGKYYWEVVATSIASSIHWGAGIANANLSVNVWIGNGTDNDGVAYYRHVGKWDYSGLGHGVSPSVTAGDRLGYAWDVTNELIWVTKDGSTWYGETTTGNPAAGTGGLDYSPIDAGPYFPIHGLGQDTVTLVPDAASWVFTPPSGFVELSAAGRTLGKTTRFGLEGYGVRRAGSFARTPSGTSHVGEATLAGVGGLTAQPTLQMVASAAFAGVGGLTANALVFKPLTATFAGIGGLTAQTTQWMAASVTFAGVGGLTANALNTKPITATLAGAGNLTAQLTQVMQASATFAGVGGIVADLTPPGAQAYQISATLAGVGGFVANALVFKPLTATLAGTGSLTAIAQQVRPITATFAGVGGFTAQATQVVAATVTFAGVGSLTASPTQVMQASAVFAGVGGISATLTPPGAQAYQISATLAGAGNLTAFVSMTARVTATFAGVGSLTADGQITKPITATLAGAGSLTAQTTQRMAVTVTFAGVGGLTSQPTQLMRALAATFTGVGGMSADLTPPGAQTYQITATLAGVGSLIANALVFKPLTATLAGAGSLTAQTTQSMRALATLAGAGGISADLTPPGAQTYQLTATLAGVGSLTANALVFKPISATFAGSGGLIVQESQRQVATATLSGAGNLIASSAQVMQASALFTGVGGMAASLTPPIAQTYQLEALLAGAGGLAGSVVQRLAVTAQLDGTGSLTASVSRQAASATALFAGAGNLTASLSQVMSARAATLGGTGGLTADPALVPSGSQAYALSAVLAGEGGLFADCGPPIKLGYQSPPGGIGEPPYRQLRPLYAEIECKIETGQSQGATGRLQQDVVFLLQTEQAPEGIIADAALDVSLVAAVRQLRGDSRLATRMAVASRGDARQATRAVDGTGGLRAEFVVKSGGEAPAVPEYHGEPEFFQPLDSE